MIEFKIAFTCSNSKRPDGFGGAACVVNKDSIRWAGIQDFLEAERTAFAENMDYFFCEFAEVVGELEYPVSFILRCPANVNAAQRFDEIQLKEGAINLMTDHHGERSLGPIPVGVIGADSLSTALVQNGKRDSPNGIGS
ncbi:hypothetical protein ACQFN5_29215 (plasmid) [Klebsiella sp. WOUb02]|uniref:hypothetical protein n=1 Tax=Klebsiella sp. WOUb02 TaxID=3161071 RepID=UPI003CF439B2